MGLSRSGRGRRVDRALHERAGRRTGHVVATDINTDWIAGSLPANVELRRHDIGIDPLPEAAFDVVHARAVLTFVPERRTALKRMIAALKPNGWLLVEEMLPADHRGLGPARRTRCGAAPERRGAQSWRWFAAVAAIRSSRRSCPDYLGAAGLADFGAEGYFVPYRTNAVVGLAKANIDQLGAAIVEAGLMDAAELERYRAILDRPDCFYPASMALISVWGRRQLA